MILGLKCDRGPLTVGVEVEKGWYQGNVVLTGISQRMAQGIAVGGNYVVAPGFTVFGEYMYEEIYQGANNFVTGAVGTAAGANAEQQGQGPGLPARQRHQLLRLGLRTGKGGGESIPAALFLYGRPRRIRPWRRGRERLMEFVSSA